MNDHRSIAAPLDSLVLTRVRAIVPEIAARADEIERDAKVPLDLLDKLEVAGAFRMCLPEAFGGEDLTQFEAARVIEEVAKADASTGWHLMVAAGSQIITSRLPLESLREYYSEGPDVWPKFAGAPKGIAVPVEGGYRLSGRWPLASGARLFNWISLGFMIRDADGVRRMPDGRPDFRICLLPRGDVKIYETWDAVGLRGTRSDDLEVKDMFVPEAWQASFFGPPNIAGWTMGVSLPCATAAHHLAIVKGILKAAIADLAKDSLTRRPAFNPTVIMKDDAAFRSRFGEIASRVDAICGLADMCIAILDVCGREGRDVTPIENARISSGETLCHQEGTSLMDQIMMLSGSAGVYMTNRMQRRWRDLRCAAQHQAANISNYASYSMALSAEAAEHAAMPAPAKAA